MTSEAQLRATAKYQRKSTKQLNVRFFPYDMDLYDYIESKEHPVTYAKDLIRKDMKGDTMNVYTKQDIIKLMEGKTFGDIEIYGDSEGWQTDDLSSPEGLDNDIYSDIENIPDIEYSDYWLMDKDTYKRTVLANSPIDADDYSQYPILCLKAAGR